jgi:hypothetical protein
VKLEPKIPVKIEDANSQEVKVKLEPKIPLKIEDADVVGGLMAELADEKARSAALEIRLQSETARANRLSEICHQQAIDLEWAAGWRKIHKECPTLLRKKYGRGDHEASGQP